MEVQSYLGILYAIRFWSGVGTVLGLVLFLANLFALRPQPEHALVIEERMPAARA